MCVARSAAVPGSGLVSMLLRLMAHVERRLRSFRRDIHLSDVFAEETEVYDFLGISGK